MHDTYITEFTFLQLTLTKSQKSTEPKKYGLIKQINKQLKAKVNNNNNKVKLKIKLATGKYKTNQGEQSKIK